MGNASGREEGGNDGSNGESGYLDNHGATTDYPGRVGSSDFMTGNSPPASPGLSQSPLMFAPCTFGQKPQLVIIKRAGHAVKVEKPKQIYKHIKEFLVDPKQESKDDGNKVDDAKKSE